VIRLSFWEGMLDRQAAVRLKLPAFKMAGMRTNHCEPPVPLRLIGDPLPQQTAERKATELVRPVCISGRGVNGKAPIGVDRRCRFVVLDLEMEAQSAPFMITKYSLELDGARNSRRLSLDPFRIMLAEALTTAFIRA
jgi:hypothetical protein